jgi:acetyltransferase-like isoleucine patch superfamily enzyme
MLSALGRLIRRRKRSGPISIRDRYAAGRGTYGEPVVLDWKQNATQQIGSVCSISDGVTIYLGGNHRVDWITTYPFTSFRESAKHITGHPHTKGSVVIGNDVWIGNVASILSGVKVGNGAVIAACAVVTKDVPAYAIVAGNPGRVVRKRFSDENIAALEQSTWWDWPDELLDKAMPILLSGDAARLVQFASAAGISRHPTGNN